MLVLVCLIIPILPGIHDRFRMLLFNRDFSMYLARVIAMILVVPALRLNHLVN